MPSPAASDGGHPYPQELDLAWDQFPLVVAALHTLDSPPVAHCQAYPEPVAERVWWHNPTAFESIAANGHPADKLTFIITIAILRRSDTDGSVGCHCALTLQLTASIPVPFVMSYQSIEITMDHDVPVAANLNMGSSEQQIIGAATTGLIWLGKELLTRPPIAEVRLFLSPLPDAPAPQ